MTLLFGVNLLRDLYKGQERAVKVVNNLTDWFSTKKGVWQGCLVSSMCFQLLLLDEFCWVGVNISLRMNSQRFADANDNINIISWAPDTASEFQLVISTKETKIMAATREPGQLNILCSGVRLEQVKKFKYLGSIIDQTASCNSETRV